MEKAYVLINCDLGHEGDTLVALRSMKSVNEAHGTFGAYDIIVEVANKDVKELREDITWKIRKLPTIRNTLTLMAIEGQG
ncbi:Lrp/AsnC ligand binding domain-containing protein [Nitrosopumilus ureiphilus]|uniref:AsnC family transcriptional regulator n=1 Tax=Nitrosopumilus ureiphilus TaxID=1470067 RepID=A0A7D5R5Q7_9ARCH|nr:Lrp/AsnC ligand binding domain-containing protein [Nitrosopumilus ureiphilus]QLH06317.1 AsnC family transcriptional regulator [Nitrosopumilus ureiphilus]